MITPGVAASLTPTSVARPARPERGPRVQRRVRVPQLLRHLPHLHVPHRHA